MSNLSLFLKKNKIVRANTKYVATKSLCDENGNPLEWEIKALSTRETENIRAACTIEVPVTGKPGAYRQKADSKMFIAKLISSAVVFTDLYDKELQDSYGVKTPEELIVEMIDNPVEYNAFAEFVQDYSGISESLKDKVDEAKN